MATTLEGAIAEVLFTRMASLALSPVHPIAYPNLNFTPPTGNRYLRAAFVPNTVNRVFIDSDAPHQRMGFLQVSVCDALNVGQSRALDIAAAVAAHFPCDLQLIHATGISVRITSAPSINDMMVEQSPPGVLIPILIPWEVWA